MNNISVISIKELNGPPDQEIIEMLSASALPVSDLVDGQQQFLLASVNDKTVGAIAVYQYGDTGLLRSMIVHPAYRTRGIAKELVERLEQKAASLNIRSLYLLTETADRFFSTKGFVDVSRADAPLQIQTSAEFSSSCPSSAVLMVKQISF